MTVDAIVIGAGFAGLYAVQRCVSEGLTVLGIEAAPGVGGTWYWNRYPGARCDVESVDYSYSFDEHLQSTWTWTERYAAQPEILAYLEHVADRFDLRRHYMFGTEVTGARFHAGEWVVQTSAGERRGRFLLCATGCLSAVNRPDVPGLTEFAGEVHYTAAWPRDDPDLRGKKIGVIGTGSSGIQAVPILAAQAESLVVFQRSPNYTVPMPNHPWSEADLQRIREEYPERRRCSAYAPAGTPHGTYHKSALDTDPQEREEALWRRWRDGGVLFSRTFPDQTSVLAANDIARRFAEGRIRDIVADPAVADDLIPTDHPIGTKRICTDAGYYETFNRDNVRLVNLRREPIEAITLDGVRTISASYKCDVLVFATGFDALTGAMTRIDPVGPGGDTAVGDLGGGTRDVPWADGAAAAEPVQLQRAGQSVGAGEHGSARGGPGRLGGPPHDRGTRPRPHRGRAASRCGTRLDRPRSGGRGADAFLEGQVVVVLGGEHRRQKTGLHAVRRWLRQLSNVSRQHYAAGLFGSGAHDTMNNAGC